MGNVVEFPTAKVVSEIMKEELLLSMQSLEENYQLLDQLHQGLHVMEEATSKHEEAYNAAVSEYIDLVGIENVQVDILEYSTAALVEIDGDGHKVTDTRSDDE